MKIRETATAWMIKGAQKKPFYELTNQTQQNREQKSGNFRIREENKIKQNKQKQTLKEKLHYHFGH